MVSGRYTNRLYIAYSSFYVMGTLLSMQVFGCEGGWLGAGGCSGGDA